MAFFRRSRLPKPVLAKVWSAVDAKKRGLLELPQFVRAMWLIALVQEGATPERASLDRLEEMGRPLPQLVGINCEGELLPEDSPATKAGGSVGGGGGSGTLLWFRAFRQPRRRSCIRALLLPRRAHSRREKYRAL